MTETPIGDPAAAPVAVAEAKQQSSGVGAALIASGILLSRVLGLLRQALTARYLGATVAADAFNAAFKIPNMLQMLFGEGALSAAFIPPYSALLGRGEKREAEQLAGSVASLLALVTALLVLLGVLAAPLLVSVITPGFSGERRELTIHLTRLLFPGAGVFVLSAWCLGILNSHRRFLLAYAAPAAWNVVMIGTLLWFGPGETPPRIAVYLALGSVAGALLQFLVQLPLALRLVGAFRARVIGSASLRQVTRGFVPVAVSRGAVQLSAFVDQIIASLLPTGMVAMIGYAQTIYVLPVSLFGISISAAELPELSREAGPGPGAARRLAQRLDAGLRRIAFFVIPCVVVFFALGDVVIATLLQSGRFGPAETLFTWGILAASSIGLLAATLARLYSSGFYALHDTRTPFRFAVVRIAIGTVLAATFALLVTPALGIDRRWGAAGLTLGSALAAWVELGLLRSRLSRTIGRVGIPDAFLLRVTAAALVAGAVGIGVKMVLPEMHRVLRGTAVFSGFGIAYLATAAALGITEVRALTSRVTGRLRR